MQQQQPGIVTHSRISSLLIFRHLTRPRVASRYSVRTSSVTESGRGNQNQNQNHHRITPGGNVTKDNCVLIKLKSPLAKQLINSCEMSTCSCAQSLLSPKHRWHRAFTKCFIHWIQLGPQKFAGALRAPVAEPPFLNF